MKLFYAVQGKYKDGRNRIVIVDKENKTAKVIPKPEEMLKILNTLKLPRNTQENSIP